MARRAICGGVWPSTIGKVSICASRPSTASCSIAAGRRTSSEAISTLRRCRSVSRLASLAVVVVLPEPCRPTIMMATGGAALRSMPVFVPWLPAPSVATSWSCTIFTTIWPGVTDFITSMPTASFLTPSTNARATSSATSASSSARRTSRNAASTSASLSAPRRVRRSRMPPSFSDNESNISLKAPLRPRAHRAVGRWPPASQWTGRRIGISRLYRERREPRFAMWPSQGRADLRP